MLYLTEMDKKYKYKFAKLIQKHYDNFNIRWTTNSNNKTKIDCMCQKLNSFNNFITRYTCKILLANDTDDGKVIDLYGNILNDPNIDIDDGRIIENGRVLPIKNEHVITTCGIKPDINLYDNTDVFYYYGGTEIHKRYNMEGMIFYYNMYK